MVSSPLGSSVENNAIIPHDVSSSGYFDPKSAMHFV